MSEEEVGGDLGKRLTYLVDRLEETTRELTRADVQLAALGLQKRQAVAAFNFIRIMHERTVEATTVDDLCSSVVEAITSDLAMDAAAVLDVDTETREGSVLASSGFPDDTRLSQILADSALLEPGYISSESPLQPALDDLKEALDFPHAIWYPETDRSGRAWVLLAANRREDLGLKQPFTEATLEILGAVSSSLLSQRARILHTQEMLRQREQRIEFLAEIIRTSPLSVIVSDPDWAITYVNQAAETLYGYEAEELIGKKPGILNTDPGSTILQRRVLSTVGRGVVWRGEIIGRKKNGGRLDLHASIYGLKDHTGETFAYVGFQEDIGDRIKSETALRRSERRYRGLADLLPQVVCEADQNGVLSFVNTNGLETFGYRREDLSTGLSVFQMLVPEDVEDIKERFHRVLRGETLGGSEHTALRRDGTTFPIMIYASPIVHGGATVGVRAIVVDITERKKVEAELQKMQRLESLGVLAGGIAHDFNNILTGVLGNISFATMDGSLSPRIAKRLEAAEDATIRAGNLTQQLLTFSKGGKPIRKPLNLAALLRNTVEFALSGSDLACEFEVEDGLCTVEADESQLYQVINNLVINAKQATPGGGLLRVGAENLTLGQGSGLPLEPGRYVSFSVQDEGGGIAPAHLERVFDPYFSTKQEGSGLGLAVSYSIINRHEGHITAESELGVGATFRIYLPASEAPLPTETPVMRPVPADRPVKVLLMDDEEVVQEVVGDVLTDLGYEVTFALNGEEAIRCYAEAAGSGRPFDVAILDLTIPGGTGGKECCERLVQMDPDVKAIVSSGYSDDPVMANFRKYGFRAAIPKPYRIPKLCAVISDVLRSD